MKEIQIFTGFDQVLLEVAAALLPLTVIYLFLQIWLLKYPKQRVLNSLKGIFLTFIGLSIFLQGVYIGFLPAGKIMGEIMGGLSYNWVLVPVGFILGFVVAFAEPSVPRGKL